MIILGIDPGTKSAGYAVVEFHSDSPSLLVHGVVPVDGSDTADRLKQLRLFFEKLIALHQPTHAGVETLFFSKNRKTALSVSQARGVILELLAEHGVITLELLPAEVKIAITGSGNADKRAVASMASRFLSGVALLNDDNATDAVAIALATGFKIKTQQRLST